MVKNGAHFGGECNRGFSILKDGGEGRRRGLATGGGARDTKGISAVGQVVVAENGRETQTHS